jgi:kinetochore protein Mis12/MTW1
MAAYNTASRLPPLDPTAIAELTQFRLTDPGKREWETSRTGYLNWAIARLIARTNEQGAGTTSAVGDAAMKAAEVANPQVIRAALEATEEILDEQME